MKVKPEKNSGLNGIQIQDFIDTGIGEVMASNPIQALISQLLEFSVYLSLQFKYVIFHIITCIA